MINTSEKAWPDPEENSFPIDFASVSMARHTPVYARFRATRGCRLPGSLGGRYRTSSHGIAVSWCRSCRYKDRRTQGGCQRHDNLPALSQFWRPQNLQVPRSYYRVREQPAIYAIPVPGKHEAHRHLSAIQSGEGV